MSKKPSAREFDGFAANFGQALGKAVLVPLFCMWKALYSKETPAWAKTVIIGAIAYAVCPIDAIPDAIPVFGLTDDAAVISAAFAQVVYHITPEMKKEAKKEVKELLS